MNAAHRVCHHFEFDFPATHEPAWSNVVDRWYQLDPFAYGLAEFYSAKHEALGPHPSMIVLASPGGSNETDYLFASGGGSSPGKFVHTLPNIRISSLCQVMAWTGPMLCLQRDPHTEEVALEEAKWLLGRAFPRIWVMGVISRIDGDKSPSHFTVHCTVLNAVEGSS